MAKTSVPHQSCVSQSPSTPAGLTIGDCIAPAMGVFIYGVAGPRAVYATMPAFGVLGLTSMIVTAIVWKRQGASAKALSSTGSTQAKGLPKATRYAHNKQDPQARKGAGLKSVNSRACLLDLDEGSVIDCADDDADDAGSDSTYTLKAGMQPCGNNTICVTITIASSSCVSVSDDATSIDQLSSRSDQSACAFECSNNKVQQSNMPGISIEPAWDKNQKEGSSTSSCCSSLSRCNTSDTLESSESDIEAALANCSDVLDSHDSISSLPQSKAKRKSADLNKTSRNSDDSSASSVSSNEWFVFTSTASTELACVSPFAVAANLDSDAGKASGAPGNTKQALSAWDEAKMTKMTQQAPSAMCPKPVHDDGASKSTGVNLSTIYRSLTPYVLGQCLLLTGEQVVRVTIAITLPLAAHHQPHWMISLFFLAMVSVRHVRHNDAVTGGVTCQL